MRKEQAAWSKVMPHESPPDPARNFSSRSRGCFRAARGRTGLRGHGHVPDPGGPRRLESGVGGPDRSRDRSDPGGHPLLVAASSATWPSDPFDNLLDCRPAAARHADGTPLTDAELKAAYAVYPSNCSWPSVHAVEPGTTDQILQPDLTDPSGGSYVKVTGTGSYGTDNPIGHQPRDRQVHGLGLGRRLRGRRRLLRGRLRHRLDVRHHRQSQARGRQGRRRLDAARYGPRPDLRPAQPASRWRRCASTSSRTPRRPTASTTAIPRSAERLQGDHRRHHRRGGHHRLLRQPDLHRLRAGVRHAERSP